MPFIKIEYGSSRNISVQGVDYIDVDPDDLDENGNVPERFVIEAWQQAVNEFMEDTSATVVANDGD